MLGCRNRLSIYLPVSINSDTIQITSRGRSRSAAPLPPGWGCPWPGGEPLPGRSHACPLPARRHEFGGRSLASAVPESPSLPGTRSVGSRDLARGRGHACTTRPRSPWASRDVSFPSPRVCDATRVRAQRPSPGPVKRSFSSFSPCCQRENEDGVFFPPVLAHAGTGHCLWYRQRRFPVTRTREKCRSERGTKKRRGAGEDNGITRKKRGETKKGKENKQTNNNKIKERKAGRSARLLGQRRGAASRLPRSPVPSPTAPQRLEPSATSCGAAASRTPRPDPSPPRSRAGIPLGPQIPLLSPGSSRPRAPTATRRGGERRHRSVTHPKTETEPPSPRCPPRPRAPLAPLGPGGEAWGVGVGGGQRSAAGGDKRKEGGEGEALWVSPTCAPRRRARSAGAGSIPAFMGAASGRLLTLAQSKDFAGR